MVSCSSASRLLTLIELQQMTEHESRTHPNVTHKLDLRTSFAGRGRSKEGLQTPGWGGRKMEGGASDGATE